MRLLGVLLEKEVNQDYLLLAALGLRLLLPELLLPFRILGSVVALRPLFLLGSAPQVFASMMARVGSTAARRPTAFLNRSARVLVRYASEKVADS
jgi:hypothetical protein